VPFTAAVVGLGRIGQGFDYDRRDAGVVLTHATGFAHHQGFRLTAGVDPDPGARARFEEKFAAPAYPSVAALYAAVRPDVVSIAVPTALHASVFAEVVARPPRAILLEKPIAARVTEAEAILAAARAAGCAVLVNYMRRFEPAVLELKRRMAAGALGEVYKATVWYAKGLLNNGSHFIDLLSFLLGPARDISVLAPGRTVLEGDAEPDLHVRFGTTEAYVLAAREECFSIAEMTLLGTGGVVRYEDAGANVRVQPARPDPVFPGYVSLDPGGERLRADLDRIQLHVAEALYLHLSEARALASDADTATATLAVVEEAFRRRG
jgi:predicted dehydrogenase